jgi:hypothetical protein
MHYKLADALYKTICKPGVRVNATKFAKFQHGLAKSLRANSQLSGWAPTGFWIWLTAALMIIVGVTIGYLVVDFLPVGWPYRKIWELRNEFIHRQILITCEVVFFPVPITFYGHRVVKRRATFRPIPDKKRDDDQKTSDQLVNVRDDEAASNGN